MLRAGVSAYVVAVVLTTGIAVEAHGRGVSVLKRQGATLLSRWQQRVGVSTRAKSFLSQMGMAAAFCTALACGQATQPPEITAGDAPAVSEAPALPEAPERQTAALITTELFGKGFVASRGLNHDSTAAYVKHKEELPLQFYDGMMVHQVKDGRDYARIVDLVDGKVLKVRYIGGLPDGLDTVDVETISGVLVGRHPDYGNRYVSFAAEFARPVNDDKSHLLLAELPAGTILYGEPNVIFSDGDYVIKTVGLSFASDNKARKFPQEVRFFVNVEHLVTITRPASPSPGKKQQRRRMFERNKEPLSAHYRVEDGGVPLPAASLLISDEGVFLSR